MATPRLFSLAASARTWGVSAEHVAISRQVVTPPGIQRRRRANIQAVSSERMAWVTSIIEVAIASGLRSRLPEFVPTTLEPDERLPPTHAPSGPSQKT